MNSIDSRIFNIDDFVGFLDTINPRKTKGIRSPHKYVLLLTVIKLVQENPYQKNQFIFGLSLKNKFETVWNEVLPDINIGDIEHPFYHLISSSFWFHKIKDGKLNKYNEYKNSRQPKLRFTPKRIQETIEYGYLDNNLFDLLKNKRFCNMAIEHIQNLLDGLSNQESIIQPIQELHKVQTDNIIGEASDGRMNSTNHFVSYLNALHNLTPSNEGALAEAQAQNSFFGSIHVPSILTKIISDHLLINNNHVILTGHAGDGKSTIGLELYKQLMNFPMEEPLAKPMLVKEKIQVKDKYVFLIKDMSELSLDERLQNVEFACNANENDSYFIISNTGNLLSTLKKFIVNHDLDWLTFESNLLTILQESKPSPLSIAGSSFIIINLAQIDNLETATLLLDKIINSHYWEKAGSCPYKDICPISLNIRSLKASYAISKERIFSVYRFLYEYGHRLTLRQITAHLSHSITASLDCKDIKKFASLPTPPIASKWLFYNTFFGFEGEVFNKKSERLATIEKIKNYSMGAKPYPPLERELWFDESSVLPQIPKVIAPFFESLMDEIKLDETANQTYQRGEIRRFLFVFGDNSSDVLNQYLPFFIGSLMLYDFIKWQSNKEQIGHNMLASFERKILHVLQEQYTGIILPESCKYHHLYITLKRSNLELRQSVQILATKIPLSNFKLSFETIDQVAERDKYKLVLSDQISKEKLVLDLPFLDFVMMRNVGEVGQKLNISYIDRLERFKNMLLASECYSNRNNLELLEYNSMGDLETYQFCFNDGVLEVSDAY